MLTPSSTTVAFAMPTNYLAWLRNSWGSSFCSL